jgi:tetratricopeptide (TPR) repeat protein
MTDSTNPVHYKVRLATGRVLGPLTLAQLGQFISKGHIHGDEAIRAYPSGDWQPIRSRPEVAVLLGGLSGATATVPLPSGQGHQIEPSETAVLPEAEAEYEKTYVGELGEDPSATVADGESAEDEKTVFSELVPVSSKSEVSVTLDDAPQLVPMAVPVEPEGVVPDAELAQQSTVMLELPTEMRSPKVGGSNATKAKAAAVGALLLLVISEILFPEEDVVPKKLVFEYKPVEVEEPVARPSARPDAAAAEKLLNDGRLLYYKDTFQDYRRAAAKFKAAAEKDPENTKALALLASSYLNLIDVSNRDEKYFLALSRMLEFCRMRGASVAETVISDVEFYVTLSRADAAYNRIVDYARGKQNSIDSILYFYLAYATAAKGDAMQAAGLVNRIPDTQIYTPRIYYLRGELADKLGQTEDAIGFFAKAIEKAKQLELAVAKASGKAPDEAAALAKEADHPKSRLRLAQIFTRIGKLATSAKPHIEALLEQPWQLSLPELAQMHYLRSQIYSSEKKPKRALDEIRRARTYDPDNRTYILELASLESKSAGPNPTLRAEARMIALFTEAEQQIAAGDLNRAVTTYIKAAQENPKSPLAQEKLGDFLMKQNDLPNARRAYEVASGIDPKDGRLLSKYIDTLIRSYDWDTVNKVMEKARAGGNPLRLEKSMADMYARQGRAEQAAVYYRQAMSKGSIDPELYVAYGNLLLSAQQFKDAPFYFSMALRFDPANTAATIGIAKAVALRDGIVPAIRRLEDELGKTGGARAEILAAIAEFNIQRGEWAEAERFIAQAKEANPEYPYPHKLEAQIHLNREGIDKGALDRALDSYKAFSDRNPSDPSGYLERYKVFVRRGSFEAAVQELQQVRLVYPKYPNLNYYEGVVRALQGNHAGYRQGTQMMPGAIQFFRMELENHSDNLNVKLALAKSLIETQQLKEARDILTEARAQAPKSAEIAMQAGRVYILLRQFTAGMALLKSSLALDSSNPAIYRELGHAHVAMGDPVSARSSFQIYLSKEPNAPDRAEIQRYL